MSRNALLPVPSQGDARGAGAQFPELASLPAYEIREKRTEPLLELVP